MQKQKNTAPISKRTFFKYTGLFLLLAAIIFTPFILQGKTFIHQGDGFHQHFPFFRQYLHSIRDFFATGNWQSWDWSIGLGADTLLTYGYYVVGDPFVYLGLLFPSGAEEFAFHVIMVVRVWAVGISFLFYARKMKFNETSALAGTIMYAFSHFAIYNVARHPFFIHTLIWFPLIALGIEKVFRKESGAFFAIVIGLSAISNFYFFYMLTILAFLYACIRYATYEKSWHWKIFGGWLLKFIGLYLIGLLISAVVFLPQVYGFLSASRSAGFPPISLLFYPASYYGLLLLNMVTPGTIFWSVGGFSIAAVLALPFLVRKRKQYSGLLTGLFLLSFMLLFPIFGSFMNGLSGPYNRFTFVLPFYLSVAFIYFLDHLGEMTKQDVTWIKRLMIGFTVVYGVASVESAAYTLYLTPVIIGWLIYWVIKKKPQIGVDRIILGLIALNMTMNALNFYLPIGKNAMSATEDYGTIDEAYTNVFGGLEEYLPEDEWYRIGATSKDNHVRNQYAYLEVNGMNSYASLTNGAVSDFSRMLENSQYQIIQPLRNGIDDRRIANQVVGAQYIITAAENTRYLSPGYEVIHEENDFILAETEHAAPFAYVEDEAIRQEDLAQLHPVARESLLANTVIIENDYSGVDRQRDLPIINNYEGTWAADSGIEIEGEASLNEPLALQVHEGSSSLTLEFAESNDLANQEVFLYLEGIDYQPPETSWWVQDSTAYRLYTDFNQQEKTVLQSDRYTFSSYFKRENILFHLNEGMEADNELILEFQDTGQYSFENVSLVSRPNHSADNQSFSEGKNENVLEIVVFSNEYIRGTVDAEAGMLVTSMPFSGGWSVYVDGEEAPVEKVNTGFVGVLLDEGAHEIEFMYETPLLKVGFYLTVLGIGASFVVHQVTKKERLDDE